MTEDRSVLTRPSRAADEVVSYGAHPDQIADVRFGGEEARRRPLVLIVHGGFWRPQFDRAHTGPMAEAVAAAGWTVASIEYRRVPGEPDKTLEDVSEALLTLPAKIAGHDGSVILVGHSAGGHLALWLAATARGPRLAGTVALAPAADLRMAHELGLGDGAAQDFIGADPATRPDADPRRLASAPSPVAVIHGDDDEIVPMAVGESYVTAHPAARLVRLAGAGHFAPIDPLSADWPAVVAELRRLSRAASQSTSPSW